MKLRVTPEQGMVRLSDLIIHHPEMTSFADLLVLIAQAASDGARFLNYDVKPDFGDTPRRWEMAVENAFTLGPRYLGERT
jgi:hypothetical protein